MMALHWALEFVWPNTAGALPVGRNRPSAARPDILADLLEIVHYVQRQGVRWGSCGSQCPLMGGWGTVRGQMEL